MSLRTRPKDQPIERWGDDTYNKQSWFRNTTLGVKLLRAFTIAPYHPRVSKNFSKKSEKTECKFWLMYSSVPFSYMIKVVAKFEQPSPTYNTTHWKKMLVAIRSNLRVNSENFLNIFLLCLLQNQVGWFFFFLRLNSLSNLKIKSYGEIISRDYFVLWGMSSSVSDCCKSTA